MHVKFHTSDIALHVNSDSGYLVLPNAKSRVTQCFYLSDYPDKYILLALNRAILLQCKVIKHIVSSVESKSAGLFYNC